MRTFGIYHRDAVADIVFLCPSINRDHQKDFGPDYPHPIEHMQKVTPEIHNLIIVEDGGPGFNFSASANAGIKNAKTDFVVIYSDDVYPVTGWLGGMLEAVRVRPKLGIVGAVQYLRNSNPSPGNSANRLTHIGGRFDEESVRAYQLPRDGKDSAEIFFATRWCRADIDDDEMPVEDKVICSDWVNGAILGIPRKVLDELGGFDERFPFFWEDVDICWRARRLGYEVGVHYDVECVHVGGATVRNIPRFSQDASRELMRIKIAELRGRG